MLLGTLPAEAGTRPPCANLETFTRQMWKPDAVCVCVSVSGRVCVVSVWRPSVLVTLLGKRSREILSGSNFCGYDDIEMHMRARTHTLKCMHFMKHKHAPARMHVHTQTHSQKAENYRLACEH